MCSLSKRSWLRPRWRQSNCANRRTSITCRLSTPDNTTRILLDEILRRQRPTSSGFSLSQPRSSANSQDSDRCAGRAVARLSALSHNRLRPRLTSQAARRREVCVLLQYAEWPKQQTACCSACGAEVTKRGMALRHSMWPRRSRPSRRHARRTGRQRQRGAHARIEKARLDERGDKQKALEKWSPSCRDGYHGQWRDLGAASPPVLQLLRNIGRRPTSTYTTRRQRSQPTDATVGPPRRRSTSITIHQHHINSRRIAAPPPFFDAKADERSTTARKKKKKKKKKKHRRVIGHDRHPKRLRRRMHPFDAHGNNARLVARTSREVRGSHGQAVRSFTSTNRCRHRQWPADPRAITLRSSAAINSPTTPCKRCWRRDPGEIERRSTATPDQPSS